MSRFFLQRKPTRAVRTLTAVLGASSLLLAASCTIDTNDESEEQSQAEVTHSADVKAKINSTVKDGQESVNPGKSVLLTSDKPMKNVSMTDAAGNVIKGKFNDEKTRWANYEKMDYSTSYTIAASNEDTKLNQTFTTVQPSTITDSYLAPLDGATVGVGQSIALKFDSIPSDRKAVQDAIEITTEPKVEGAFYWISATEVRWRPEEYWEPGTKVSVKSKLKGVDIGDGLYAATNRSADFTIGDDVRAVVDDATKTMTITKNGEKLRSMPTSNGRDNSEWATPNGIYQIGDQYDSLVMDSNTFGVPESAGGYVTPVNYATQMSYSGIYIHGAPWSVWAQGSENTSHGCINVTDADAQWVYENMKRGDIVEVKNTTGTTLPGYDGLGDWNIDWDTWKAGNAEG